MIPIEKNVIVVDQTGKEYESTYPKRARGLVKNGRARFIAENKICLACPPNEYLEECYMDDKQMIDIQTGEVLEGQDAKYTLHYVLEQIEKIAADTEYLHHTLEELGKMSDGENAESMSPGNTLGQSKAQALGDIVQSRELTNQKLIQFYEKVYDDLKPQKVAESVEMQKFRQLINAVKELSPDVADSIVKNAAQQMFCQYPV